MLTVISLLGSILVVFCVIKGIYNFAKTFILRFSFTRKLNKLCAEKKYKISYPRSPYASIFKCSSAPDIALKTPEKEYLIRLFTCRQRKRIFFFINANTYIKVFRVFFALPGSRRHDPFDIIKTLGQLPDPDSSFTKPTSLEKVRVLLFNPAPAEINYIDENNNKLIAGNGSVIHGWTVYSAEGIINALGGRE